MIISIKWAFTLMCGSSLVKTETKLKNSILALKGRNIISLSNITILGSNTMLNLVKDYANSYPLGQIYLLKNEDIKTQNLMT